MRSTRFQRTEQDELGLEGLLWSSGAIGSGSGSGGLSLLSSRHVGYVSDSER